jgi:hypothetical protein
MPQPHFLNLEYIFYKIYDFFLGVFGGGFGSGSLGNFFANIVSIIVVLIIVAFLAMFCVVIYTRLRMYDLNQKHKEHYDNHFVKPIPPSEQPKNPRWEYIEKLFASANSNDWRIAIIEADTMLDELVQSYNFPGDNLGERLKNASPKVMPTLQSAWEAHKVRNKIAHDGTSFQLSEREAHMTKKHFEFVFSNAGVI